MDGLFSLLLFAGLFFLMMRFGCGGHVSHGGHDHQHVTDDAPGGIDPVCGMQVPADGGYSKVHQGRRYQFCSRNCLDKFEANPDQYLAKGKEQS